MSRPVLLIAGIALLGACATEPTATDNTADLQLPPAASRAEAPAQRDLAALRAATARFHRIDLAKAAGYDTQFPAGCFASPQGAMGFHWLNGANVGTLEVTRPQLVLYEPREHGRMKLVGVEYIVPGASTDTPPVLFGQTFHYNATFGVWALHVWAWERNPRGLFADWNPRVSCEHATDVSAASDD